MQHPETVIILSKVLSLSDELIISFLIMSSLTVNSAKALTPSSAAIVNGQLPSQL